MTKTTIQQNAELLVSSPVSRLGLIYEYPDMTSWTPGECADKSGSLQMRRPLETLLLGYPELKSRLDAAGKPVIILDTLQEVNK